MLVSHQANCCPRLYAPTLLTRDNPSPVQFVRSWHAGGEETGRAPAHQQPCSAAAQHLPTGTGTGGVRGVPPHVGGVQPWAPGGV